MSFRNPVFFVLAASPAWIVLTGCSRAYEPGLGELMSLTQMRHAKLWYAGQAGNWELAEYEIDELQEGFEDVPSDCELPVQRRAAASGPELVQ